MLKETLSNKINHLLKTSQNSNFIKKLQNLNLTAIEQEINQALGKFILLNYI